MRFQMFKVTRHLFRGFVEFWTCVLYIKLSIRMSHSNVMLHYS